MKIAEIASENEGLGKQGGSSSNNSKSAVRIAYQRPSFGGVSPERQQSNQHLPISQPSKKHFITDSDRMSQTLIVQTSNDLKVSYKNTNNIRHTEIPDSIFNLNFNKQMPVSNHMTPRQPSAPGFHTIQPVRPMVFRNQRSPAHHTTEATLQTAQDQSPVRMGVKNSQGEISQNQPGFGLQQKLEAHRRSNLQRNIERGSIRVSLLTNDKDGPATNRTYRPPIDVYDLLVEKSN